MDGAGDVVRVSRRPGDRIGKVYQETVMEPAGFGGDGEAVLLTVGVLRRGA